jgi:hypothetical protein
MIHDLSVYKANVCYTCPVTLHQQVFNRLSAREAGSTIITISRISTWILPSAMPEVKFLLGYLRMGYYTGSLLRSSRPLVTMAEGVLRLRFDAAFNIASNCHIIE